MTVVLTDITKAYGTQHVAVKDLDLDIKDGEFFTLLGPSGCGKTTTLRMIAGLEQVTNGTIAIHGRDVTHVPARLRDVAMVFQSYALYPHMTVHENLALNLKVKGLPKAEVEQRVQQVATMLRIDQVLKRKPGQLSGGQRQRVALGRAIVRRPNVFLMDEPLSNLDLKLREETRTELKKLHEDLRITTVYVTHDQSEALVLSDRIGVMNDGRLLQVGGPHEVYSRPADVFVARFIGSPSINLLEARLHRDGDGLWVDVSVPGGAGLRHRLPDAIARALSNGHAHDALTLGIRPEDFLIRRSSAPGRLAASVDFIQPMGAISYAILRLPGGDAVIRERDHLIAATDPDDPIERGTQVWLEPRSDRICLFDQQTGRAVG
ncbi:MAG: multiple sugar transport system ATP-binding protein [Thermomicrobiales bacterium]|jgi:ABC-type sugar transport system ATPase subunit|nr:multiple sugar transport system ATP-binding protein [Thermomicrobiales bacterium]MEA2526366.1 multiple sugar transport system ATP-binding protein [Thermomicrobiales bacterium]